MRKLRFIVFLGLCFLIQLSGRSQAIGSISLDSALIIAEKNNPQIKLSEKQILKERDLLGSTININPPELLFEAPTGDQLRPGILQSFDFPATYAFQYQSQNQKVKIAESEKKITLNELKYKLRITYNELLYYKELLSAFRQQDSLIEDIVEVTNIRFDVGQVSNIERVNAESQLKENNYRLGQIYLKLRSVRFQLALLTGNPSDSTIDSKGLLLKLKAPEGVITMSDGYATNPAVEYYSKYKEYYKKNLSTEYSKLFPGFIIGYLNQSSENSPLQYRMRYGVTIPIWLWTNVSQIKAAKKDVLIMEEKIKINTYQLKGNYNSAVSNLRQFAEALNYFESTGLPMALQIQNSAQEAYRLGSIGYYNYILNLQQVIKIRLEYLEALKNYNESIYTIQYLKGE